MKYLDLVKGKKYNVKIGDRTAVMVLESTVYRGIVNLIMYEENERIVGIVDGKKVIARRYKHDVKLSQVISPAE